MINIPMDVYFDMVLQPEKVHEIITAPINYFNLINQAVMVYDENGNLLNASVVNRVGISEFHKNYTIWFDDGEKRRYLRKIFSTHEEAESFLESIYNIKK